jgi:outer membrane protein TolC
VNSAFGLEFEYPLGNREAEARRRAARLRTLQSAIDYRDAVRRAITDVKVSLRTLETNYRLIQQTRLARIAAAENLRALQVEEETIRGLTPDFLNLKLNRQEALAQAEVAEAQARADYARAAAETARALGLTLEQSGFTVDAAMLDEEATRLLERDPDDPLLDDRPFDGRLDGGGR